MDKLTIFNNDKFGEIRTVEDGDKVLFCASDIAKALGYANAHDAVARHCRASVKRATPISGKIQDINFIPEGDVYRLICHSKLPSAEIFERWVFDEVLPQIRRNGGYIGNIEEIITKTATAVATAVAERLLPLAGQGAKPKKERHRTYQQRSVIEQLEPELKAHVDEMIKSNAYSCQSIANYIAAHGVTLSQMAVSRYAHKYFWDKEGT